MPSNKEIKDYKNKLDECLVSQDFTDGHLVIFELVPYYLYLRIRKVVFAKEYFIKLKDLCIKGLNGKEEEKLCFLYALCLISGGGFKFSTFLNDSFYNCSKLNVSNLEKYTLFIDSIFGPQIFRTRLAFFHKTLHNFVINLSESYKKNHK